MFKALFSACQLVKCSQYAQLRAQNEELTYKCWLLLVYFSYSLLVLLLKKFRWHLLWCEIMDFEAYCSGCIVSWWGMPKTGIFRKKKYSRVYCRKTSAVFQFILNQISRPNHPSLLNPGTEIWITWLWRSKDYSSVCLHSWEIETAAPLGANMDNFMASVRGQPADWVWEENSLLQ